MAKCSYCGSTILFGGKQEGDLRFCNETCLEQGSLIRFADQLPEDLIEAAVQKTYEGNCPKCHRRGPVDVHTSYRVWSMLVTTSWSSRPQVCCSSCGWQSKLADTFFCLLLGWWGIPWGLIMTPVQIGRNVNGIIRGSYPTKPSDELRSMVRISLAKTVLQSQQRAQ